MTHPVIRWQLLSRQPEQAQAFYTELFGWHCSADNPLGYRELRDESGRGIDGGIWPAPEADHAFIQLFVAVEDVDAHIEKAVSLGGRVVIGKQALPDGGEMAVVTDPEGVPLALLRESSAG